MCDVNSFIASHFWLVFFTLTGVCIFGGILVWIIFGAMNDTKARWLVTTKNFILMTKLIFSIIVPVVIVVLASLSFPTVSQRYPKLESVVGIVAIITIITMVVLVFRYSIKLRKSWKDTGQQFEVHTKEV